MESTILRHRPDIGGDVEEITPKYVSIQRVKVNKIFECKIVSTFLPWHKFKDMFFVLKRTVSLRQFF